MAELVGNYPKRLKNKKIITGTQLPAAESYGTNDLEAINTQNYFYSSYYIRKALYA